MTKENQEKRKLYIIIFLFGECFISGAKGGDSTLNKYSGVAFAAMGV